jgi:ABC-type phosphate transport system substrate-binding protein
MKRILIIGLTLLCTQVLAATDLVVVVNPASGVDKMSRDDVTSIFMGRTKKLPSGITALPIDQPAASGDKAKFYRELINKELAEVNSYWARLIFSGQGSPPRQADNTAEVMEIVGGNKGAIGYVPRSAADKRVKIILDLSSQ